MGTKSRASYEKVVYVGPCYRLTLGQRVQVFAAAYGFCYDATESCWGVGHTEGKAAVLKLAHTRYGESRQVSVLRRDAYLPKTRLEVQRCEVLHSSQVVEDVVHAGHGELVLNSLVVESAEVVDESYVAVGLLHQYDRRVARRGGVFSYPVLEHVEHNATGSSYLHMR